MARKNVRTLLWLLPVVTTASLAAGCGSSSGGGASSKDTSAIASTAQQKVKAGQNGTSTWTGPASSPKPEAGKKIVVVQVNGAQDNQSAGAVAAGKAMGWDVEVITTQSDQAGMTSGVSSAINKRPDGVILLSAPVSILGAQLKQAAAAHIPVIEIQSGNSVPAGGYPDAKSGIFSDVSPDLRQVGALDAWAAIDHTKGKPVAGIITDPNFQSIQQRADGFTKVMKSCDSCQLLKTRVLPVAKVATDARSTVDTFLQSNPNVNVVLSTYDGQGAFIVPAIDALGKGKSVAVVGADGEPQSLGWIGSDHVQIADVVFDQTFLGWAAIDQMNRALHGDKPASEWQPGGNGIGIKLITKSNVPAGGKAITNTFDYQSKLKQLWGAS